MPSGVQPWGSLVCDERGPLANAPRLVCGAARGQRMARADARAAMRPRAGQARQDGGESHLQVQLVERVANALGRRPASSSRVSSRQNGGMRSYARLSNKSCLELLCVSGDSRPGLDPSDVVMWQETARDSDFVLLKSWWQ